MLQSSHILIGCGEHGGVVILGEGRLKVSNDESFIVGIRFFL